MGSLDAVLEGMKAEVEKDPGHASDILGRSWSGFRMGQLSWMYETDHRKDGQILRVPFEVSPGLDLRPAEGEGLAVIVRLHMTTFIRESAWKSSDISGRLPLRIHGTQSKCIRMYMNVNCLILIPLGMPDGLPHLRTMRVRLPVALPNPLLGNSTA